MFSIINERIINYIYLYNLFFIQKNFFLYFKFLYRIKFLRITYANCYQLFLQGSGSGGLTSTCSSSNVNTSGGLHGGIGGGSNHSMGSQQPAPGTQNQVHSQQQPTIRHKVHIV